MIKSEIINSFRTIPMKIKTVPLQVYFEMSQVVSGPMIIPPIGAPHMVRAPSFGLNLSSQPRGVIAVKS